MVIAEEYPNSGGIFNNAIRLAIINTPLKLFHIHLSLIHQVQQERKRVKKQKSHIGPRSSHQCFKFEKSLQSDLMSRPNTMKKSMTPSKTAHTLTFFDVMGTKQLFSQHWNLNKNVSKSISAFFYLGNKIELFLYFIFVFRSPCRMIHLDVYVVVQNVQVDLWLFTNLL